MHCNRCRHGPTRRHLHEPAAAAGHTRRGPEQPRASIRIGSWGGTGTRAGRTLMLTPPAVAANPPKLIANTRLSLRPRELASNNPGHRALRAAGLPLVPGRGAQPTSAAPDAALVLLQVVRRRLRSPPGRLTGRASQLHSPRAVGRSLAARGARPQAGKTAIDGDNGAWYGPRPLHHQAVDTSDRRLPTLDHLANESRTRPLRRLHLQKMACNEGPSSLACIVPHFRLLPATAGAGLQPPSRRSAPHDRSAACVAA